MRFIKTSCKHFETKQLNEEVDPIFCLYNVFYSNVRLKKEVFLIVLKILFFNIALLHKLVIMVIC